VNGGLQRAAYARIGERRPGVVPGDVTVAGRWLVPEHLEVLAGARVFLQFDPPLGPDADVIQFPRQERLDVGLRLHDDAECDAVEGRRPPPVVLISHQDDLLARGPLVELVRPRAEQFITDIVELLGVLELVEPARNDRRVRAADLETLEVGLLPSEPDGPFVHLLAPLDVLVIRTEVCGIDLGVQDRVDAEDHVVGRDGRAVGKLRPRVNVEGNGLAVFGDLPAVGEFRLPIEGVRVTRDETLEDMAVDDALVGVLADEGVERLRFGAQMPPQRAAHLLRRERRYLSERRQDARKQRK